MWIYVAGSIKELDRAQNVMTRLRQMGHAISEDWTTEARAVAAAQASGLSVAKNAAREEVRSRQQAKAIRHSDLLILLVSPHSKSSYCEFGYALGAKVPTWVCTPVSASWLQLASALFDSDDDMLAELDRLPPEAA